MQDIFSPQMIEIWSLAGSILGTLLAILLLLAATLWASKHLTQQARGFWAVLRGHESQVIAQVDDPADPINAQLARITAIPAEAWAAILPAFVSALSDALSAGLSQPDETHDSPVDVG